MAGYSHIVVIVKKCLMLVFWVCSLISDVNLGFLSCRDL